MLLAHGSKIHGLLQFVCICIPFLYGYWVTIVLLDGTKCHPAEARKLSSSRAIKDAHSATRAERSDVLLAQQSESRC